jgi:hypothetical protein
MVGPFLLAVILSVAQPVDEDARLMNCMAASREVFGEESPEIRHALCLATIRSNEYEKGLLKCVEMGSAPCPEPAKKTNVWSHVAAGAGGLAIGAVVTVLAFTL